MPNEDDYDEVYLMLVLQLILAGSTLVVREVMRDFLEVEELRRRAGAYRRGALMNPFASAFMCLFNSGLDATVVGQNQIQSSFMVHLGRNVDDLFDHDGTI